LTKKYSYVNDNQDLLNTIALSIKKDYGIDISSQAMITGLREGVRHYMRAEGILKI
jgi:hypothetical protein